MKRVLISQRVDRVPGRNEVRDNLDVLFIKLLWEIDFFSIPVPNFCPQPEQWLIDVAPDAVILSGGNNIGEFVERDFTEKCMLDYAKEKEIPVFAICRGLQFVNEYLGGECVAIENHVAKRHTIAGALFPNSREVNSFHNYAIDEHGLAKDLEILAQAEDGSVEAAGHRNLPWLGVMWHPERETPLDKQDKNILTNFLSTGKI